jgi:glyoxylase I family protein
MEKVLGIGGVFFRARDPLALASWYREHLGVDPVPEDYEHPGWRQQAGPTAWAPFPENTTYFDPGHQWMINFRVANLDAMVEQLRAAGSSLEFDANNPYPNGRFARTHDPEGNAIELWEPTGRDK